MTFFTSSTEVRCLPTCTFIVCPSTVTSPVGAEMLLASSACFTLSSVRLCSLSLSGAMRTNSFFSAVPLMLTELTPGTVDSCGSTFSSRNCCTAA